MHRSRIGSVVIDCDDYKAGISFWRQALGVPEENVEVGQTFASLGRIGDGWRILIQRVSEPKTCKTRMHIDIESDDIAAEVLRLEALGARRVEQLAGGHGWVLADPTSNEFCVLTPSAPGWPHGAIEWP